MENKPVIQNNPQEAIYKAITPDVLADFKVCFETCDHKKLDKLLGQIMPDNSRQEACIDKGDILTIVGKMLRRQENPGHSWSLVTALQYTPGHPDGLAMASYIINDVPFNNPSSRERYITSPDAKGCNPALLACLHVPKEATEFPLLDLLVRAGCDIRAVSDFGKTALHMAAIGSTNTCLLDHLLNKYGLKDYVTRKDARGHTPAHSLFIMDAQKAAEHPPPLGPGPLGQIDYAWMRAARRLRFLQGLVAVQENLLWIKSHSDWSVRLLATEQAIFSKDTDLKQYLDSVGATSLRGLDPVRIPYRHYYDRLIDDLTPTEARMIRPEAEFEPSDYEALYLADETSEFY
ncbi:hypothetical protein QBC47DRAFT_404598 [Echria macrotheca]|uniref:Ankyrin repeat protein n=1 Tax=Echria macrotheca TaxID=438768 RepID=A0AAJ0F4C5_9PEZI|nr:hypothetical protein QBC47DRAFT_404598 [Echria macrotheca]